MFIVRSQYCGGTSSRPGALDGDKEYDYKAWSSLNAISDTGTIDQEPVNLQIMAL